MNVRCPSLKQGLPSELVCTSEPGLSTFDLNPRLHQIHPACLAFPRLLRHLGVRQHFTLEDYEWSLSTLEKCQP